MKIPPANWVREIPFDVADWGDTDPQPPVVFKDRAEIIERAKAAEERLPEPDRD